MPQGTINRAHAARSRELDTRTARSDQCNQTNAEGKTIIIGLDSATPPTAAQALAARNAGCSLWSGYLQTRPGVGLYHGWSGPDFENARRCGATPIAFCSGWDDPNSCRQLAAQWNVRLCLDVESGIRGDGPWVQSWLDASGAGLYGNLGVHSNRHAAFHVLAWYLADPKATWPPWAARPSSPCGWQFFNTHNEFGVGVDRAYYDDWFAGGTNATAGSEVIVPQEVLMSIEQATAIARMMLLAALPTMTYQQASSNPPAGYGDWVGLIAAALMPGSGKDAAQLLAQFIAGLPKSAGAAGPAGPKGEPGPAGPPGPPTPSHKHTVTGTAEINT